MVNGLARHGKALHARNQGGFSYDGGLVAAREILNQDDRPDAVFCANDIMALALIDVASKEFGLSVPNDFSVIGFDNIPTSGFERYGLTTIDQNIERMSDLAVEILISNVSGDMTRAVKLAIPCRLIRRSSVKPRKSHTV